MLDLIWAGILGLNAGYFLGVWAAWMDRRRRRRMGRELEPGQSIADVVVPAEVNAFREGYFAGSIGSFTGAPADGHPFIVSRRKP